MRKVTFVANGKEFKTFAEALAESKYIDVELSENVNLDKAEKPKNYKTFGVFTGKIAKDWKAK